MARRKLRNLDERILKRVIYYGAKNGVGDISTKKIASDLRITEPTIYVHFKTKVNLLRSAYDMILNATYEVEKKALDPLMGKKDEFIKAAPTLWLSLLNHAYQYREMVIYAFEYRHSATEDENADTKERQLLTEFFMSMSEDPTAYIPSATVRQFLHLAIETMELFCFEVAKGLEKPDATTAKVMSTLVIHGAEGIPFFLASLSPEEKEEQAKLKAKEEKKTAAKPKK